MPLHFCHPEAPHKKLRVPEWYISSLMLDRALDAVVRRVKTSTASTTSVPRRLQQRRQHDLYRSPHAADDEVSRPRDRYRPFPILHEEVEKRSSISSTCITCMRTRSPRGPRRRQCELPECYGATTTASCRSTSRPSATSALPKCQPTSTSSPIATSTISSCSSACTKPLKKARRQKVLIRQRSKGARSARAQAGRRRDGQRTRTCCSGAS